MKLARIKQAKLNLEKAHTTTQQVSDGLQTSFFETKSSYISAYNTYLTNRKNIETAEKIYKHTLIKYKAGMATSLELSQSQTQYLQSQSNYYTSVIGLTSAKSKLEKMLK